MAKTLASLKSELQENVPTRNGIPSDGQYDRAIKNAATDLPQKQPLRKRHILSVVSGTATYTLPDDFVSVVKLVDLPGEDGAVVTDAGIIPVSDALEEEYVIADGEITFYPTPTYTSDRYLWYAAGYTLDGSDIYQDMDDSAAYLVMLKAQVIALRWQANKASQEAWQYQMGDERVNKEKLADSLRKQADEFEAEYDEATNPTKGPKQLMKRSHRS